MFTQRIVTVTKVTSLSLPGGPQGLADRYDDPTSE